MINALKFVLCAGLFSFVLTRWFIRFGSTPRPLVVRFIVSFSLLFLVVFCPLLTIEHFDIVGENARFFAMIAWSSILLAGIFLSPYYHQYIKTCESYKSKPKQMTPKGIALSGVVFTSIIVGANVFMFVLSCQSPQVLFSMKMVFGLSILLLLIYVPLVFRAYKNVKRQCEEQGEPAE